MGIIDSIQDIEENIWMPRLGLKGKIDVTVKVKCGEKNGETRSLPLELKTGRASFSPEHTGQLIIYQMIMSEIDQTPVESGLLLYLREGVMREVKASHNERRDLLLLRNEISYYLTKQYESYQKIGQKSRFNEMNGCSSNSDEMTELMKVSYVPELPEPINRQSVCANCAYNILCSIYLNQDTKTLSTLSQKHPMREIAALTTVHLTDAHINYFCHWVGLMALEDQENKKCIFISLFRIYFTCINKITCFFSESKQNVVAGNARATSKMWPSRIRFKFESTCDRRQIYRICS